MKLMNPKSLLCQDQNCNPEGSLEDVSQAFIYLTNTYWDFPGGAVVKNPPANAGGTGSSPGQEDPTCCRATKPVYHN